MSTAIELENALTKLRLAEGERDQAKRMLEQVVAFHDDVSKELERTRQELSRLREELAETRADRDGWRRSAEDWQRAAAKDAAREVKAK